jgi:hypothetical protein
MSRLKDITAKAVRELGSAYSVGNAIVAADAAATYSNVQLLAGTLTVVIKGVPTRITNVTNKALLAAAELQNPETGRDTFYTQPAGTTVYYLVVHDNVDANWYVIQGTYVGQLRPFSQKLGDGAIPDIAIGDKYAPLAILKVVNATNPFIPGTTAFNAAGVTTTVVASLNRLWSLDPADYTFA